LEISKYLLSGVASMPSFPFVPSGLKTSAFMSVSALAIIALLGLSGCGGDGGNSGGGGSKTISVSVTSSATTINGGGTVTVTATVANDSSNAGVTWTAPSIGSLTSLTALVPTYTAPAATSAAQSVTLTATSVADTSKSASVTLTINPKISVSVSAPATMVDGNDAELLTATVANDSSNAGVTWTAPTIGSLSSLTASAPTFTAPAATASAQTVTLTATSVADKTQSNSVTLTIPAAPAITTSSLPTAIAGAAYSTTLAGSGGISPYTWKLTSGTLPTGMSLNATTGVLSAAAGATTATPASSLTFVMTDSGLPTALTATATLSLTINAINVSVTAPVTTVDGNDSVTVTATVTNDSGNAGVTWTAPVIGSLSSLTALVPTYTAPAAAASAQSVTLTATSVADKTKSNSVTLTIPIAPTITTSSLPSFVAGTAYSTTLAGSGGIGPYTWTLTSGTLPVGMSLNAATGLLSAAAGATTTTPATNLTFQMTDSGTPTALTATATLSLTINPQISVSVSAPVTTVDGNDTVTVTATVTNDSSNAGVTWTAPSIGSLSSLSAAAPTFTAPAATASAQSVTLTATSVADKTKSNSVTLTIPAAPAITTTSLPTVIAGVSYSTTLAGSGGIAPYTWKLIGGTMPVGLSLNATTGEITAAAGATTTTPATNLTFQMTDSGTPTALTASATLSLTINPPPSAPVAGSVIYSNSCGYVAGPATTVSINTNPVQSTTTDNNGNFSFAAVPQGSYTITPSLAGTNAVFSPATQNVTVGTGGAVVNFNAAVGYSVSGNVSYSGAATGPIHLILQYQCPGGVWSGHDLGTSILTPGPFTINGAAPGSYQVLAWIDAVNNGWPNASDPTGSSTLQTVSSANLSGISVTMTDPTAPTFTSTPYGPGVVPFDQGAILYPYVINESGIPTPAYWLSIDTQLEIATSYTVEWGTDKTFATYIGSQSFPAKGGYTMTCVLNGLTNGQQLYFRYQGVVGSATSAWSPAVGPITIGAPTGPVKVSGTATFANAATGPLYIYFENRSTGEASYTAVASPVSPQNYSIQLPAAGNYYVSAFIDQNNDNIEDNGDMLSGGSYNVAVTGSTGTFDLTLNGGGTSYLSGGFTNYQNIDYDLGETNQLYNILAAAWSGSKELTAMELASGPNVVVPQDLAGCAWEPAISFCGSFNLIGNTPNVGDAYGFKMSYIDGTSETKTYTLASVPGSFGANPSPSGPGTNLTPNISWTDPPNASDYTYKFSFSGGNPAESWVIPAPGYGLSFSSSINSLTWGVDPTGGNNLPSPASLSSSGGPYAYYDWSVIATDSSNNDSVLEVGYYVDYTPLSLPAPNPSTLGAATVGQSYSGTITAASGQAPYLLLVTGLSDGLSYSSNNGTVTISGTPLAAGAITFNVIVFDSDFMFWGPVTYTINVGN